MLPSLRELGLLSARYAEEEEETAPCGRETTLSPMTTGTASLPESPEISSTTSGTQEAVPPVAGTAWDATWSAPSSTSSERLRALGLLPLPKGFQTVTAPAQLLAAAAAAEKQQSQQQQVGGVANPRHELFSSIAAARLRKSFHKRRPAHVDKSMLVCHFCGRKETPEWRKGPSGPATLCNACGLQWAKKQKAQRRSECVGAAPHAATVAHKLVQLSTAAAAVAAASAATNTCTL